MKILIGICGLGLGHSLRERVIIDYLLSKNVELCLLTDKQSTVFYQTFYPNVKILQAEIPFVACGADGINYDKTIERTRGKDYFLTEIEIYKQIEEYFGIPDLVLSDYELYSARFAYIHGIRLINLEQQSKYLGFNTLPLDGFSREEEASRLRLFFPRSDCRFAASFFEIDEQVTEYPVQLVGPVICDDVLRIAMQRAYGNNEVLVYVSPFAKDEQYREMIFDIVQSEKDKVFHVFTNAPEVRDILYNNNVHCYNYDREIYLDKLLNADFAISNAGHQFISEAILLEKPVLVYPFSTYDQHYCAHITEKNGLGFNLQHKSHAQIVEAIQNISVMRQEIISYKKRTNYERKINNILTYIEGEIHG